MINQVVDNNPGITLQANDLVEIPIMLEAKSPLLLGSTLPSGNVVSSLEHVPGSTWRGALASTILDSLNLRRRSWQQQAGALPTEFEQVFNDSNGARFGFLYPIRLGADEATARRTLPMPLTARQCKQEPGFVGQGHGVLDGLRNRVAHSLTQSANRPLLACPHPGCAGRLERVRGYASRLSGDLPSLARHAHYRVEQLDKHSFVRVALNRYTETAQDQFLYVQDALIHGSGLQTDEPEPLVFVGSWRGTAKQAETFRALLAQHLLPVHEQVYELRIGLARARGMGGVYLHLLPPLAEAVGGPSAALAARLHDFQPRSATGGLLDEEHRYASLTVRSLLQLLDNSGLTTSKITADLLRSYCPAAPASLEVWEACTLLERQVTGGWSGAWGLPKVVTPAIAAGSVLVVRAARNESDQFQHFLTEIEQKGLGENLAAGWGDVLICDSFHLTHDEGQVKQSSTVERG